VAAPKSGIYDLRNDRMSLLTFEGHQSVPRVDAGWNAKRPASDPALPCCRREDPTGK